MTIEYLCEACVQEVRLQQASAQCAPPPICPQRKCGCGRAAAAIVQHDLPSYADRQRAAAPADATLTEVLRVYHGSDGDATTALYERLWRLGPAGAIAVNLFRACKNSARAKVYRGGGYRGAAYDRKQWAMDNLDKTLWQHAGALDLRWGWGEDEKQTYHRWVLYVDLPTGQVSFHTKDRGTGPDYPAKWDGAVDASAGRICRWCAQLLSKETTNV